MDTGDGLDFATVADRVLKGAGILYDYKTAKATAGVQHAGIAQAASLEASIKQETAAERNKQTTIIVGVGLVVLAMIVFALKDD